LHKFLGESLATGRLVIETVDPITWLNQSFKPTLANLRDRSTIIVVGVHLCSNFNSHDSFCKEKDKFNTFLLFLTANNVKCTGCHCRNYVDWGSLEGTRLEFLNKKRSMFIENGNKIVEDLEMKCRDKHFTP